MAYRPRRRGDAGREGRPGLAMLLVLASVLLVGVAIGAIWWTGAGAYSWWWLTNTTPPTLALDAPSGPVRGSIEVELRVGPEGRAAPVEIRVDDRPLPVGTRVPVDTASLPDGQHLITAIVEDRSWRRNRTTATLALSTDNTPPVLTLESLPRQVLQGHTWLLRIRTSEPAAVEARLGDRTLEVQAGNGYGWALVGFGPMAEGTTLPVVVVGQDPAGNRSEATEPVELAAERFPQEQVDVPTNLAALLEGEVRTDEDRRLAEHYRPVTQPRLWEGRFLLPVTGQIITQYGTVRSYNGGPVVGHHQGMDIAVAEGRPVLAPARGRVAVIDEVRLRGKIVILDHGLGVYTTYAHLSAIDVQVGQSLERGQAFAKIGSTGLSTGPHLHWELWVGGANVNPIEWTERDFP